MSVIEMQDTNISNSSWDTTDNFDYQYPRGLDLSPKSELHKMIISKLKRMGQRSRDKMSGRYPIWKKIDRHMTVFVELDEEEKTIKAKDNRKPTSIIVPEAFAIREALLTRFVSSLLGKVYFPYEGVGPEDTLGAILMQHVVQRQMMKSGGMLALNTMFSDGLTYGIGPVALSWNREMGQKKVTRAVGYNRLNPLSFLGFQQTGTVSTMEDYVRWEGSELHNIDPYLYLPDPDVPAHQTQKGEFVGWLERSNYIQLLMAEVADPTYYFNVQYLARSGGSGSSLMADDHGRGDRDGVNEKGSLDNTTSETRPCDVMTMYVRLIPAEWKLGRETNPQVWVFKLVNDRILIQAQPLGMAYDMFPVVVCAPDYDGYSVSPLSRMELAYPSSELVSWYLSVMVTEQRKTQHNTYLMDPYKVNEEDVKKAMSSPGGIIRLRRSSWGSGVKDALEQMQTSNVTAGNMNNAQFLMDIMERVVGASDQMQGSFEGRAPERRTKAEFNSTFGMATQRVGRMVMLTHAMCMRPLGIMLAENTKQLMSQEAYVKLIGNTGSDYLTRLGARVTDNRVLVTPQQLQVNFDIEAVGPDIASHDNPDSLLQLTEMVANHPLLSQQYNLTALVNSVACRLGEKNFGEYQLQIMPPQMAQQVASDGNYAAVSQTGGME